MTPYGHPRSHRLLTARDFQQVFNAVEVKAACPELLFLAKPGREQGARLGFVISKKNVRTAVARNRVKRAAKEVFRHLHPEFPALDVILLGRKGLSELSQPELQSLIRKQLLRLDRRWQKQRSTA
ncbi:MAG: ribonuclease P protein component [Saccharospirillum sp.]|nr:ribonuclease P protein component [Saccharospirillum sp.]